MREPAKEGLVTGDSVLDANGFIRKYELPVGRASSLGELSSEYAFFTPAILYLRARFRDAPLADFIYSARPSAKFYYRTFSRPIFRGLEAVSNGDPTWNYALWAVRLDDWPALADWLVSITLTYEDTGAVAGVGEQRLEILDPLAVDSAGIFSGALPSLGISSFGINGSRFRAGLSTGDDPLAQPSLVLLPPADDMKVFAEALYGGENPLDAKSAEETKR